MAPDFRPLLRTACATTVLLCSLHGSFHRAAQAQLRIVTYNTATANTFNNPPILTARPEIETVFSAIGSESVGGIAKPIDVLLLQEQFSTSISTQSIVDVLNGIYGLGTYARSIINGQNTGPNGSGGSPALVYNTQTVELIDEIQFGPVGGGAMEQPRATMRYQLRPVGYDSSADFYAYNSHYKAESAGSNVRRLVEAESIRNNSDALGEGTHAIYAGDYNITSSNATMYQELLSSGNGQAFDPIDSPGVWKDKAIFKHLHTQSSASTDDKLPSLAGGGVDDRFDFQLVTGEFLDQEGLSYLPGSYHVFGNNGTHSCNGTTSNPCDSSINTGTGASPVVLNALMAASDHLPVVADYQLPAVMDAHLAALPGTISQGSLVSLDLTVSNLANVLTAIGADELDYSLSVSGALLLPGSAAGVAFPLDSGNLHSVRLDTAAAGFQTGLITVASSSQSAANALINIPVSFTVGTGGGGPVFGVVAEDNMQTSLNRLSFTHTPALGVLDTTQDGFQVFQISGAGSIPPQLRDNSAASSPNDTLGIVDVTTKLDPWFGVTDLVNNDNPTGLGTATWTFDISGAFGLEVSIDMAAMGDFEAGGSKPDFFDWTYSIDGGAALPLFTSAIDESATASYTLADGDVFVLNDPLTMLDSNGQITQLSNLFQTLTSPLASIGDVLTIELISSTDGGSEAYAFDNLVIEAFTASEFLAADFNMDGAVDGLDLAQWQGDFGLNGDSDADNDGDSDSADFLVWQQQFGSPPPSLVADGPWRASSQPVPEPTTAWIFAWLLLAIAAFSRTFWSPRQTADQTYNSWFLEGV